MIPLLGYQAALLLRSHRWLPPLLFYGAVMAVGLQSGQPVLDSFGWAAAVLVPVAAWFVRVCVTNEPDAARNCAVAAVGPWRVHLAGVLTALLASTVLAVVGTVVVAAISDPRSADHRVDIPLLSASVAGLTSALACALLGTGVGALCNRPLLRSTAWAVPSTVLAALVVTVATGSPANAAVTGLVTGSQHGTVTMPLLPLAVAAVLAAGATAVACAVSARR
ncbi:ABC transporter [Streptomyces sp. NPDC001262]|uniref:ABC transporter n=1 Tax=unclassified Streptomyces TaxID=2593676 RepID=UPI00368663E1